MTYSNIKPDVKIIGADSDPKKTQISYLLTSKPPQKRTFINTLLSNHKKENTVGKTKETNKLLPILDPSFNLREIVKQIILVEDHLRNKQKQCHDCIVKHFLFIESLAEETIGLYDTNDKIPEDILNLPENIREIQKLWYKSPHENSIIAAQQLRVIRKQYMEPNFGIVFDTKSNYKSCSSSKCKIKD